MILTNQQRGSIVVVITAYRVEGVSLSTRYPVYCK